MNFIQKLIAQKVLIGKEFVRKNILISVLGILGIPIFILIVLFAGKFAFSPPSGSIVELTRTYDIKKDYCGKLIDIHYCQCAFEGENCEVVGMANQDDAVRALEAAYTSWVMEKQKEECAEKGGRWKNDVCRK